MAGTYCIDAPPTSSNPSTNAPPREKLDFTAPFSTLRHRDTFRLKPPFHYQWAALPIRCIHAPRGAWLEYNEPNVLEKFLISRLKVRFLHGSLNTATSYR